MVSPFERSAIHAYPAKPAWDASAAEILGAMLGRWRLSEARVFPATAAAVVAEVRRADGRPAVLKIGYPHVEAIWEAVALDALGPTLAPAVLGQDVWTWAMLLERLDPGDTLADAGLPGLDAVGIGAELHRRITVTPPPDGIPALVEQYRPFVGRLGTDAAAGFLRDAGLPDRAAGEAIDEFGRLCATAPATALLHGDLNPGNVLRHGSSWRVIDPKPAVGDPAFDTFSLVRDLLTHPGSADEVSELTEAATAIAGVEVERALRWTRVRGTLSAFWNLEDGLTDAGRRDAELVRTVTALLGR